MYVTEVRPTRQLISVYDRWQRSVEDLYDVYDKPSCYKIAAWEEIDNYRKTVGGKGLAVIGASCHAFSCAFMAGDYMYYFTRTRSIKFKIL